MPSDRLQHDLESLAEAGHSVLGLDPAEIRRRGQARGYRRRAIAGGAIAAVFVAGAAVGSFFLPANDQPMPAASPSVTQPVSTPTTASAEPSTPPPTPSANATSAPASMAPASSQPAPTGTFDTSTWRITEQGWGDFRIGQPVPASWQNELTWHGTCGVINNDALSFEVHMAGENIETLAFFKGGITKSGITQGASEEQVRAVYPGVFTNQLSGADWLQLHLDDKYTDVVFELYDFDPSRPMGVQFISVQPHGQLATFGFTEGCGG